MAVQMFLVHPKEPEDECGRETLATLIAARGGFILMATSAGSLIAALDDSHIEMLRRHPLVELANGVTLNPTGPAAAKMQRMFAQNVAAQLVERGLASPPPAASVEVASARNREPGSRPTGLPGWFRPIRRPEPVARTAPSSAASPRPEGTGTNRPSKDRQIP